MEKFGDASNTDSLIHCRRARMWNGKVLIRNREAFLWGNKWHPHLQLTERRQRYNETAGGCYRLLLILFDLASVCPLLAKTHNSLVALVPRVAGQQRECDKDCKQATDGKQSGQLHRVVKITGCAAREKRWGDSFRQMIPLSRAAFC